MTRQESRQRYRDKVRAWYKDFRDHSSCLICGETDPALLQYHHLDPTMKDNAVCHLVSQARPIRRVIVELEKCVCLCESHHAAVHRLPETWELRTNVRDHTLDLLQVELLEAEGDRADQYTAPQEIEEGAGSW